MSLQQRWGVWCCVSGGVTGHREAWLKSDDGRVEFMSCADAEAEATRLNKLTNGPYARAFFNYAPREIK